MKNSENYCILTENIPITDSKRQKRCLKRAPVVFIMLTFFRRFSCTFRKKEVSLHTKRTMFGPVA